MNMVILKSGKIVPASVMSTTMAALEHLANTSLLAFSELVETCRNNNHLIRFGEELKSLSLIQPDGSVHKYIRDIVLSATEGEGSDMKLVRTQIEPPAASNDTHANISLTNLVAIVTTFGFEEGYRRQFTSNLNNTPTSEDEVIFYHEEKGLILYAETYRNSVINPCDSVSSAKIYGEVIINGVTLTDEQRNALIDCSHSGIKTGAIQFDIDYRRGFRTKLNSIATVLEFSKSWSGVPSLWFLNHVEAAALGRDYYKADEVANRINQRKIAQCTPEARKIIYGYAND